MISHKAGFKIIDPVTATGLEFWAPSLAALFIQAARGLTSMLVEVEQLRPIEERHLEIRAKDVEALMVAWINEIIYLFDTEGFLVEAVSVREVDPWHLKVVALGEQYNPDKHVINTPLRAASYHHLSLQQTEAGSWEARVLLDA